MPAYASWFRVHPRTVLKQVDASIALLEAPSNTAAMVDLQLVGLDGPLFRAGLAQARAELVAQLAAQADAEQRLQAARVDRRSAASQFFAWRGRLFARLRLAARQGGDPERSFAKVFGYRKVPQLRAAGLVRHGAELFVALEVRSASLAARGVDAAFVAQGRALYRALTSHHAEVADVTAERKVASAAVQQACETIREQLLVLVAADEAAALEVDRPVAFGLKVLRPPT